MPMQPSPMAETSRLLFPKFALLHLFLLRSAVRRRAGAEQSLADQSEPRLVRNRPMCSVTACRPPVRPSPTYFLDADAYSQSDALRTAHLHRRNCQLLVARQDTTRFSKAHLLRRA